MLIGFLTISFLALSSFILEETCFKTLIDLSFSLINSSKKNAHYVITQERVTLSLSFPVNSTRLSNLEEANYC